TLYIGTDLGVFYKDPSMAHWEAFNNGLPVIEVTDLSINYATNELWAATYGRGVWKSPKHTTPAGVPSLPLALDVINVSPNPNKGQCTISTANNKLVNQKVSVRIISYSGTNILHVESKFDS